MSLRYRVDNSLASNDLLEGEEKKGCEVEKLLTELRKLNGATFFLIAYDFKDNNSRIKKELIEKYGFYDESGKKSFPDTTLFWKGNLTDTIKTCVDNFEAKVRKIITNKNLDTEFEKTFIVEIMNPKVVLEDK